jgi:tetratricopeptide (TPR) repeat protein
MILDNADDIDVFRQTQRERSQGSDSTRHAIPLSSYIPQTTTGSVLLTTRDKRAASWLSTGYTSIIMINPMGLDDAEQLLYNKIPDGVSTKSERYELVRELDYFPLAITQAAAYISAKKDWMTVPGYLALYQQDEKYQSRLLDEDSGDLRGNPGVPNSVIQTWQISFDQIQNNRPRATELLSLMAVLDRQNIPKSLICTDGQDALDFVDSLGPLDEFSLITIEKGGESFEMHRLVQLATRKWLEKHKEAERWRERAIELLSKAFPTGEYTNWERCETLLPHAREVLRCEALSDHHSLARGSLLYNMASYSLMRGSYTVARAQVQESSDIRERLLDKSDVSIFASLELLGVVLQYLGKYDEAETMNRRALAGYEIALGPEHPSTLTSVNNLSIAFRYQGKYDEAETMNRRALVGREIALGPQHPDTLMSIDNLAIVLRCQGKYNEAETTNRRALAGLEMALGPEHPDTLISVYCLAYLLQSLKRFNEAIVLYDRAYNGLKNTLGLEHPTTRACSDNRTLLVKQMNM